MGASVITLDKVGVCYRPVFSLSDKKHNWALRDVSFELCRGETLGVVGLNGSAKCSLHKILGGIINCDSGSVKVQDNLRVLLLSLQVGFMPLLTGRENIMLSGLLLGLNRKQLREKTKSIIEYTELGKHIDNPVRQYSAGMKARLGFAIACHTQPDVFLIDEALGVGDKDFRAKSSETMRNMIASDASVVLVSHNNDTIKKLTDRVVLLENGGVKAIGQTEEIMNTYR